MNDSLFFHGSFHHSDQRGEKLLNNVKNIEQ